MSAIGVTAGLAVGAVGSAEARAGVRWELLAAETRAQHVLNPQNRMYRTHNHTWTPASQKRCFSFSVLDTINR